MALTPVMSAIGIPISKTQCIGDSLHTINAAFSTLDFRTSSLTPPTTSSVIIGAGTIPVTLGNGTTLITVSGDFVTTGNTSISGNLITDGNTVLGQDCTKNTTIQGTLRLPCINQNAIEFNNETTSFGNPVTDGATIQYQTNLFGPNQDGLLIEKTDFNNSTPDGGIAFRNRFTGGGTNDGLAIRGHGRVGVRTMNPNKDLTVVGEISATNPGNIFGTFISNDNNVNIENFNLIPSPTIIPFWDSLTRTFSAVNAFMPLQQGGGAGQGNNKIHIGWNAANSKLNLQVDTNNFNANWPIRADTCGVATSAIQAGTATYADTANWANNAISTGNATNAAIANYANSAGHAATADTLTNPETPAVSATGGYIRFTSGIQLAWGFAPAAASPISINFVAAFSNCVFALGGYKGTTNGHTTVESWNNSQITLRPSAVNTSNQVIYIAIGTY